MVGGGRVSLSRSGTFPSLLFIDPVGVFGFGRKGGLVVGRDGFAEGVGGPPVGACLTCAWFRDLIRSWMDCGCGSGSSVIVVAIDI